ncbi:hypothetical protein [Duganella sp. P38]|uniref:hypothetical protein n=1 Tax=Duganella sp. P38 TaxID=3423949 RepID=UPI003D7B984D
MNMPTYVKRYWNEPRGDEHDAWGVSWWYFEVDDNSGVLRQIEQYDSGMLLCYGKQHVQDEYGGLSDKPIDLSEAGYTTISSQEFEAIWRPA